MPNTTHREHPFYADEPCGRCGWKFKGFHICVENPTTLVQSKAGVTVMTRGPMSEEQKAKIGEAQRRRWATMRMEGS